jgi:hypothetical protein
MPNAKIYVISLNVSKTFLVTHLFDDNDDGTMELLNDKHLEKIQDKISKLSSPMSITWLLILNIMQVMAILIASLN